MSPAAIVVTILAITIALFISDRLPLDLVALLSLAALMLTGVLTPAEALAGFSNPIVPMIAALFVVGAGLEASGVTRWLGAKLGRIAGSRERRVLLVVMLASAGLSSFMSSTGTVAILMPVVINTARRAGLAPARLLIPLAFSSLFGGMLTLIGTPPNLVVNDELRRQGVETFGFFSYSLPGLSILAVGIAFLIFVGPRLLPGRTSEADAPPRSVTQAQLADVYGLGDQIVTARVVAGSPLVGRTLRDANLRKRYGATVIGIRRGRDSERVVPDAVLHAGDRLRLQCPVPDQATGLLRDEGLEPVSDRDEMLPTGETMAEIVLPRRSSYVGRTLREVGFRTQHRSTVLAIQRGGETLPGRTGDVILRAGDTLLVKGPVSNIRLLSQATRDLVVVTETSPGATLGRTAPAAIVALVGMLVLMTFQLVPNVLAVLLAAIVMVLAGCLTTVEAYRRVNWESVMVIAAVLPMSTALEKAGAVAVLVDGLVAHLGGAGPVAILAVLFVATSVTSQVMSNTATTVLIAPVAFAVAAGLSLAPQPFLMTVAMAASTAFATPIASPVNMLVLNAGGYRFADFARVGIPLQLVLLVVVLLVVPLFFPF